VFKVTEEWLRQFSSHGFGWNHQQLEILGVKWPPYKGWLTASIGMELTENQRLQFENECGRSIQAIDTQRKLIAAVDYPVYYTVPDGKGSFTGRFLKPEEVGTWPEK
jgi:hypothetical protein